MDVADLCHFLEGERMKQPLLDDVHTCATVVELGAYVEVEHCGVTQRAPLVDW